MKTEANLKKTGTGDKKAMSLQLHRAETSFAAEGRRPLKQLRSKRKKTKQALAIIDLGGQYCHMICRRLRDLGVQSEIFDGTVRAEKLRDFSGIILSGGPQSVYAEGAPTIDNNILALEVPILGICYGHQLLAKMLGAEIARGSEEYGKSDLTRVDDDTLFQGTAEEQIVWMSHADSVKSLPEDVNILAKTSACDIAAYGDFSRNFYGVQFHPEVSHTASGHELLRNFGRGICGITRTEKVKDRVARLLDQIREQVGDRSVFFFVSGGVDSTVAFALCARALPHDRVLGVYVDTGLMRERETEELRSLLRTAGLEDRLHIRDESEFFLSALKDATDPEEKRHIIGRRFVEVQQKAMLEYGIDGGDWLLGQGTIYPDTIESGGSSGTAALIKTHHNRCDEIRQLMEEGKVIEPMVEFYKDEVRQIGKELGLSLLLTDRWPFPGPGLAIRCLCVEGAPRKTVPIKLDKFGDYEAVRFPLRSVGVQGDSRTYREIAAIRGTLEYDRLADISTALCNVDREYNRAIVHISGDIDRLDTGFVRPAKLSMERISLLRAADHIVQTTMQDRNLMHTVWQFPTVLIPVSFNGGETIVLRPVNSEDGMTANFGRIPVSVLKDIGEQIVKLSGIDAVFLDITDKPPSTIEWE